MFKLTGKSALITGASSGIGAAIAKTLAAQGADVILHFNQSEAAALKLQTEIKNDGGNAECLQADLRDGAQVKVLWKNAESTFGKIDVLVNNAGVLHESLLALTSEDSWDEVLDVDLKAAFLLTKSAARSMARRKWGRIINISSQAGQMGDVMRAPYSAAKAGLLGLTKSSARELAPSGITCNAISPGFIDTPLLRRANEAKLDAQRNLVPQKRFGEPSEVAALALYLASEEAAYVTGQVFAIDGGLRM
jgi:3-oxoacyl-[acyl-carrier protein] reductase